MKKIKQKKSNSGFDIEIPNLKRWSPGPNKQLAKEGMFSLANDLFDDQRVNGLRPATFCLFLYLVTDRVVDGKPLRGWSYGFMANRYKKISAKRAENYLTELCDAGLIKTSPSVSKIKQHGTSNG